MGAQASRAKLLEATKQRALLMLSCLRDIVGTRWFSALQAEIIVSNWPAGDTDLDLGMRPRAEIAIALHPRIVDLWNFDNVFRILNETERVEVGRVEEPV